MFFLGLDSSTQSLTAVLIDVRPGVRAVVCERSLAYDQAFPEYGTDHGVIRGDGSVVCAPPLMWAEALDQILSQLVVEYPREMSALAAVSGSAQQHGSVYLTAAGVTRLTSLDPKQPLVDQLRDRLRESIFSRAVSPVWMDSSTTAECRAIEAAVGGAAKLSAQTGARAFERFTGPQVRAFALRDPKGYAATAQIHLVSSFMASLLAGANAAIDYGDGSGMNLMDLRTRNWWPAALDATAPDLARRLPPIQASWSVAGPLAPYWQQRYQLPAADVVLWSGDNPCSLIGSGLVREGRLAISLGTSDTVIGLMREPRVHEAGIGYVSASPTGIYMGTTVFKNGSLARERVRDAYGFDWAKFSAALAARPPGNHGAIMFPWFDPEITPHVAEAGVRRVNLDPDDAAANVRAIVEGQMMAMANHTRWMGGDTSVIHATGGAAGNRHVLQVMADVFGADVVRSRSRNSAALGAALRAWHGHAAASGQSVEWEEVIEEFTKEDPDWRFEPNLEATRTYAQLRLEYDKQERSLLSQK